jgi:GNAT superfamily N-acetyltransferase
MIREVREDDWEAWIPLWRGYLDFYRAQLDEQTTHATFLALCAKSAGMFGLLAHDEDGRAVGLAHALVHPSTWSTSGYCYLEDLFLARAARGGETAQLLMGAVFAKADALGATRVYWHTQEFNGAARSLYDQVGHRTSFLVYERATQQRRASD